MAISSSGITYEVTTLVIAVIVVTVLTLNAHLNIKYVDTDIRHAIRVARALMQEHGLCAN